MTKAEAEGNEDAELEAASARAEAREAALTEESVDETCSSATVGERVVVGVSRTGLVLKERLLMSEDPVGGEAEDAGVIELLGEEEAVAVVCPGL